jgi:hypothetical protein
MTPAGAPVEFVIDDDAAVLASKQRLLRSAGIPQISGFSSKSLLQSTDTLRPQRRNGSDHSSPGSSGACATWTVDFRLKRSVAVPRGN